MHLFNKYILLIAVTLTLAQQASAQQRQSSRILLKEGYQDQKLSEEWKLALQTRMEPSKLDSFGKIRRELSEDEIEWKSVISSKLSSWSASRDSLARIFTGVVLRDTIYIMVGFLGNDDAFTFGPDNVCLDLTALTRAYGKAGTNENSSRIDRIFSHEYTHLLHKQWAINKRYKTESFKDEVLWECFYEGLGMYRSLNAKWIPVNGALPEPTINALTELSPLFVEKLISVYKESSLSDAEKNRIQANLSRGQVHKKWGAFPVAIWLALEANGDERRLIPWIQKGPSAVIDLAKKYLSPEYRVRFMNNFPD